MQIKKLIEILQKYPTETQVMVDGYEGGFDEIEERRIKKITEQKLSAGWMLKIQKIKII